MLNVSDCLYCSLLSPICTGRQSATSTLYGVMIIKNNMANMCAKVTSTYMEFTLAFGPKPEFSFSFKSINLINTQKIFIDKKENTCSCSRIVL